MEGHNLSVNGVGFFWESGSTSSRSSLPGCNFISIPLHPSDNSHVFSYSCGCISYEVWSTLSSLDQVIARTSFCKCCESDSTSLTDGVIREFSGRSTNSFLEWASSKHKRFGIEGVSITGGGGSWKVVACPEGAVIDDSIIGRIFTFGLSNRAAYGGVLVSSIG